MNSPPSLLLHRRKVYTGPLIDTPTLGALRIREHAIVGVDERGRIAFLEDGDEDHDVRRVVKGWGWGEGGEEEGEGHKGWDWVRGEEGGWFFPGFVGELAFFLFIMEGGGDDRFYISVETLEKGRSSVKFDHCCALYY